MKKLLIIGGGTGGTIMANKMRKKLPADDWSVTVVDKSQDHFYQPGFLFIPFGLYTREDIVKPVSKLFSEKINLINKEAVRISPEENKVSITDGTYLEYDILIIATGTRISPEDTLGLRGELWHKKIFDFYTIEGAEALREFFRTWNGGNLVINIADNPIKCPVAPLEFTFFADEYFTKKGIREKVNINYVTPLSGAFTKPKASKKLGSLLLNKNVNLTTDFFLGEVDNANSRILDFGGKAIPFDCLITIPLHTGDPVISKSGLGDEFGFAKIDKNTLQSVVSKNIFVIGDAGNTPASKAGSVAHFQAEVIEENILSFIENKPLTAAYDGHSNCFIETGYNKGILIDFNYETEPLPGFFPLPVIGPMSLLKESRLNHYGKLLFKWIYWHILLPGRHIPMIPGKMSMRGKRKE
ncbi:MAG: FAD/NAD(P)-binding oxidoreductase [Bacteroidales bacterium]|jgi:sulfide:quinone oxidoreductase